jgi:hypothetical protein
MQLSGREIGLGEDALKNPFPFAVQAAIAVSTCGLRCDGAGSTELKDPFSNRADAYAVLCSYPAAGLSGLNRTDYPNAQVTRIMQPPARLKCPVFLI